ncbi:MAG TPA: hypothetical protein VMG31_12790 [Verrucomicrobiae bacterium]|nr:hypothetical protein [Verrucomicrobiae bacterium]
MRSRLCALTLSLYVAFVVLGCTSKPSSNSTTPDNSSGAATQATGNGGGATEKGKETAQAPKKEPIVVPAGTSVTVRLDAALGSKLSQAGQTFSGSIAKDVMIGAAVAIPKGSTVSGTVTDAKPLGKFAGGAVLTVRLDSINLNGADTPVQTAVRSFTAKGKGKRTAVMAGGGAALGGIIGGLAGGGKGAAIGMLAGGGAGGGGAALTGNKDIVLPAESALSFELTQPLQISQ